MQVTELYGLIRLNVSQFEAGLTKAANLTQNFRQSFAQAAADIDRSVTRITAVVGGMATGVAAVTTKLGFGFLQSRDSAEIMLSTILKDGTLAKKTLDDLFEAAKRTPFSFEGLKDGMVQLANAKVPADQLIPSLYKISDAIAAVGGKDEDIKGVTLALSQMMSSGRLNAGDMLQLTNRGIAGWDMLAERMGATVAEVRKASEAGAIDGRMAAELIIDEMGKRFAGAGDKLSQKFQGLWSSFMDQARANAGQIVEPLYDAIGRVLGRLNNAVDSGAGAGWIQRLRNMVAGFSQQIEQLAVGQGPAALEMLIKLFEQLGQAGIGVLNYLREQGPALAQSAAGWLELLQPVMEFLKAHPDLVIALLFLKGGEMLGINQAVMSLGGAFTSLGAAITGASLALPALAAGLGVALGVVLYQRNADVKKLNEELQKTKQLGEEMSGKRAGDQGKSLETARNWFATPDKQGAMDFAREQLSLAQRNAAGAQMSERGAQSNLKTRGDEIWNEQGMIAWASSSELRVMKQEVEEAKKRTAEAKEFLRQWEAELANMGKANGPAAPGAIAPSQPGGAPQLADLQADKTAEKQAAKDAKAEEKAAAQEEKQAERDAARVTREVSNAVYDFSQKVFELQDHIPDAQILRFGEYLRDLNLAYQQGEVTQEEFRHGINGLNMAMQQATQAADAQASLEAQIQQQQDNLLAEGVSSPAFLAAAQGLRAQMDALAESFLSGDLNAYQFKQETLALAEALKEAADEARAELEEQKRALMMRVMSGEGTEQDFKFIEEAQQEQAMEDFNRGLEQAFNSMFGLGDAANQLQQGFVNINNGMQQFGQTMNNIGLGMGMGNNVSPQQAWGQITNMLNSVQGQIATLYNNIQLQAQSLYYITDPQRRAQVQANIDAMQRQLNMLSRPQAPLFNGSSSEYSGGRLGGPAQQNNRIEFNFPNWSPQDAYGIKIMTDAILAELDRRGNRSF